MRKWNVTNGNGILANFLYLSQIENIPVAFSTAINLFVTVSQSESKSPFGINFNIFVHPPRSVSESPDIFNDPKQKFLRHSCPTGKLSVPEQGSVGKQFRIAPVATVPLLPF